MTNDKFHSDQDHVSADQVWLEGRDGSTTTLQKLLDLLGPLKRERRTITIEELMEMEPLWGLPLHPAADIFPMMSDAELETLAEDIDERGQLEPIRTLDGAVIVGRNRLHACHIAAVKPWIEPYSEGFNGDPLALVISSNRHRRHWTQAQLAWIALGLTETYHGNAERFYSAQPIDSSQVGMRKVHGLGPRP